MTAPAPLPQPAQDVPVWAGSLTTVRTAAPQVVLTFDDGPQPGGTEQVLAALSETGSTATFFVLVSRARRFPGLLAEVVAAGHEIGLHGLDHVRLTTLPPEEVRQRTADARSELEDRIGRGVSWVRPPYGAQNRETWAGLTHGGLTSVLWGIDQEDWRPDVDDDHRLTAALTGLAPGMILQGHDGFAGPEDGAFDGPAPQLDRGALLRRVLGAYADQGLVGRGLSEVLLTGVQLREERFPS
ncbi:polysaccharide deacetylase family protein [Friedmanniella luteola]|nr:polysaccharide deacetylase family protein [Friedmanniella luteola]